MKQKRNLDTIMHLAAAAIIRYRYLVFALFATAAVYCGIGLGRVQVNEDITAFLPANTETRQGITIMQEEFETFASANIMVSNISYEIAENLAEEIRQFPHITEVTFDDTPSHFINSSALFSVSFDETGSNSAVQASFADIKAFLAPYDTYVSSSIGYSVTQELASQMGGVILLVALYLITLVLALTDSSDTMMFFKASFLATVTVPVLLSLHAVTLKSSSSALSLSWPHF